MKKIIGRKEKLSLPEWGLKNITGKIDTGAYTSAIHCESFEVVEKEGREVLYFVLLEPSHGKFSGKRLHTEHFTQKKVKNSFGQAENRYKVKTKVSMFGEEFEAEFTLTDRSKMRNPILLGRKMLKGRFLVDVEAVHFSKKQNQ